ncbi:MAG: AAA family ATPase [Bacteroidales bacterium]|nr:AAA family ATPase [Bacteroidales bacterium]
MFDNLNIEGYRGIAKTELSQFSRINLFFGKNNCGKSSILEALFLLTGPANPTLPLLMNQLRGISRHTLQTMALEFYQPNIHNRIFIKSEGNEARQLTIQLVKRENPNINLKDIVPGETSSVNYSYGFSTTFRSKGHDKDYKSEILINPENNTQASQNIAPDYQELIVARFLSSRLSMSIDQSDYGQIVKNKDEEKIFDLMRIIEPRLIDIQLVGNEFLVNLGGETRLPINVMGDGFLKIFNLILDIHYSRDGILIVDELDNGIHYSVMPLLWKAINEACVRLNVQLFASTHSLDLIKGLVSAFKDEDYVNSSIAAYKLIRRPNDEIASVRYTIGELSYSVNQNIEMR